MYVNEGLCMLIRYKKQYEKIAMGLLSFMPDEKNVKVLQETMKQYEANDTWHLYLWKLDDDIAGVIGVRIDNDEINVVIEHISVNPAYRSMGIAKSMVDEINALYSEKYSVCANEYTERIFSHLKEVNEEETSP